VSHAKKIAQGHIYAGRLLAVIVDSQSHQSGPRIFIVGHGDPDVAHRSRSFEIRHDERFAWHDALAIIVASPETVFAGYAMRGECLYAGQVREAGPSWSLRDGATCKEKHRHHRSDHV
jgi:hypothetical protein